MSTFYPSPPPQHQQRRVGGNTPLEIPRSSYPSPPHPQSTTSPYNPHLRYNPALYNSNANTPISPYPGSRVASQSPHRSGEYNPRDFGGLEYGRVVTPPVQQFQQIQPQQTGDPPPPPYSPPVSNTNTPAPAQQAQPTRHAQIQRIQTQSWTPQPVQQHSPATPHQYYTSSTTTPSTAAFSPMSPYNQSISSSQATPLTPFSQSSGFHGHRRNVSPPPSGLQHQTSFEGITEVVPPPPPPGPPPHQQQQSSIPPPPPGPPPHQRIDSPHRSSTQNLRNEPPAPAQSPQGRQNMTRSPVLNEMYPRTSSLVTAMGHRVAPSVSTTNVTVAGQFQQPPQQQYHQHTQSHFQQATQAYQNHTNTRSQSSTPVATAQQQSYAQPQQAHYHQPPVPQLAPAPPPPPKRKMSIDFGHEHLRNSPRLAVPGQPVISEARSPIEPSNNPWRGMLQPSPSPNNQQQPRQLLTPPPTTQDNRDLLDLASTNDGDHSGDKNLFTGANSRHHEMISEEATAKSDDEGINIFINWVKQEWELREQKYGLAAMRRNGAKVGLVLRKNRGSAVPDLPSPMFPDGDTMMGGMQRSRSRRQPTWWGEHSNPVSPTTVPAGFSSLTGFRKNPRSVLSAAFEDDERSRGRASSRWWESSQNGDSEFGFVRSDGVGVQYSGSRGQRRPTKSSLREIAMEATNRYSVISQATDAASFMGKAEYPPDYKGGVQGVAPNSGITTGHQQPTQQPTQQQQQLPQVPQYPQQQYQQYGQPLQAIQEQQPPQQQRRPKIRLDILPLLTLLPPYPRTFPAINNCHPQLVDFRNLVRNLNDLEELHIISKEFQTSSQKKKENAAMEARKRRHQHSEAVQHLYQDGKINYEQVDAMDRDFESEENDRKVADLKEEFERFQKEVVDIVHSGLIERIALASEAYDQVQAEIVASSANSINNRDKEGDEIPELLEKLTLLKWLFDLKEILYREVHELLKDRNRRYKDVIVTPFYNTRQGDRIREAEEFFTQDEVARRIENDQASLKRFEEFLAVMEENVLKGVEIQISCFWDIAPLVSECFEKIPHDLENVEPIVPPEEAHENPGYEENPLIYLKEKVYFAERSCYQFVEAQTNLLCLLHEVKTSLIKAKWRLNNSEGKTAGPGDASEEVEERRLTDDLKEKVKLLESEWKEAIGNQFEEVRERLERQVSGEPVVEA